MHQLPTGLLLSCLTAPLQLLEVTDKRFTLFFKVSHPILTFLPPCLNFFDSSTTILFLFIWICAVASGGPVEEQSIKFFFGLHVEALTYIRSTSTPHRNLTTIHKCLACNLRRSLLKTCSEILCDSTPSCKGRFFCDNMKLSQSFAS